MATGTDLAVKGLIEIVDHVDIEYHRNKDNMKESWEPNKQRHQVCKESHI